jgi:hypothetical protein
MGLDDYHLDSYSSEYDATFVDEFGHEFRMRMERKFSRF